MDTAFRYLLTSAIDKAVAAAAAAEKGVKDDGMNEGRT